MINANCRTHSFSISHLAFIIFLSGSVVILGIKFLSVGRLVRRRAKAQHVAVAVGDHQAAGRYGRRTDEIASRFILPYFLARGQIQTVHAAIARAHEHAVAHDDGRAVDDPLGGKTQASSPVSALMP